MKCGIIRDLLPSYVDKLTSDESNSEVEKHLEDCSDCREIYESMVVDIPQDTIEYNKEKIKPLKKLNKRVIKAVGITVAMFLLLGVSYFVLFGYGWKVESTDLITTYRYEQNAVWIDLELTNGKVLNAWYSADTNEPTFVLTECFESKLDDRGENPNKFSYGIQCEKDSDGNIIIYPNFKYITFKLKDKTLEFNIEEIAEKLIL